MWLWSRLAPWERIRALLDRTRNTVTRVPPTVVVAVMAVFHLGALLVAGVATGPAKGNLALPPAHAARPLP